MGRLRFHDKARSRGSIKTTPPVGVKYKRIIKILVGICLLQAAYIASKLL